MPSWVARRGPDSAGGWDSSHRTTRWRAGREDQPHRPGQMLEHGQGQLRVALKGGVQLGPADGQNPAVLQRHGGGHPGTAIEKRRLAHQIPGAVDGQHPFLAAAGADEAAH